MFSWAEAAKDLQVVSERVESLSVILPSSIMANFILKIQQLFSSRAHHIAPVHSNRHGTLIFLFLTFVSCFVSYLAAPFSLTASGFSVTLLYSSVFVCVFLVFDPCLFHSVSVLSFVDLFASANWPPVYRTQSMDAFALELGFQMEKGSLVPFNIFYLGYNTETCRKLAVLYGDSRYQWW